MTDTITLTGIVATDPRLVTTEAGLDITSFRLACTQRRFDRARDAWVDGDTNWYTVTAFRALAANVGASVHKGERLVVTGRLRIRAWETSDKSGTTVEVDADAVGHDLRWGRSAWSRVVAAATPAGGAVGDAPTPADPEAVTDAAAAPGWASAAAARPDESSAGGGGDGEVGPLVQAGVGAGASTSGLAEGGDEPPF